MTRPPDGPVDLGIAGISDAVEIGAGGFGVVYRAEEIDLGRTVAVKILSGNLDKDAARRFERERRAMGTLSGHPNIVTIYRGGYTPAGNAYLVMEYLARGSLTDRLATGGPMPWPEALKLSVQVAGALETAHRAGVLHRDIKPGNILVSGLGNAKLADFGIARLQGAPETRSAVVTASLAHAPPDIVSGHRPDARSDVYSLASTLLELVSGSPPFVRPTDESMVPILARIAQDPPPRPPDTDLPEPLFRVIEQAMAKDPDGRHQTAAALGEVLMGTQQQLGVPVTPLPIEALGGSVSETGPASVPPPTVGRTADPSTSSPHDLTRAAEVSQSRRPPPLPPGRPVAPDGGPPAPPATGDVAPAGNVRPPPAETAALAPQGPNQGPSVAASRPAWLPLAVGAAVLLVVAGLVGLLAATGGGDPDDSGTAAGSAQSPGASDSVDATPTDGNGDGVTTTSLGSGPDDYAAYVTLSDPTGSVSLDVPAEWTDVIRGPGRDGLPFVAASPQLEDGFFASFDQPGVSVELRDQAATDLDAVLNEEFNPECRSAARRELGRPYDGMLEAFLTCGSTSTRLFHVVLVESFEGVTAVVRVQAVSNKDVVAADTIVDSIRLARNF